MPRDHGSASPVLRATTVTHAGEQSHVLSDRLDSAGVVDEVLPVHGVVGTIRMEGSTCVLSFVGGESTKMRNWLADALTSHRGSLVVLQLNDSLTERAMGRLLNEASAVAKTHDGYLAIVCSRLSARRLLHHWGVQAPIFSRVEDAARAFGEPADQAQLPVLDSSTAPSATAGHTS